MISFCLLKHIIVDKFKLHLIYPNDDNKLFIVLIVFY